MASHALLVSNPPHLKVDALAASAVLGIPPVEANLKVRYLVPEIWVADPDRPVVEADALDLREAGMRCAVIDGQQLRGIPSQQLVRSFAFSEQGIALRTDVTARDLRYEEPMIVLPVSPRAAEGAPPGMRVTIAPSVQVSDVCPFLDVYLPDGNRFAIYADLVDFAGLGAEATASQQHNISRVAEILRERLRRARFDDRLGNMQLRRPRQSLPPHLLEARRGYSFASPGLDELLTEIAPELRNAHQAELSSRLAFLTTLSSIVDAGN